MSIENITKTYNSFSGCDMSVTCTILNQVISLGTLQTISYSIHMDRQPVRSMGNINAKDYTLGPRTIAGSLVFAVFDKHLLYHMIEAYRDTVSGNIKANQYTNVASKYQSLTTGRHILADELPPFDITITFANEYGTRSKAALYGVRLVNEGQVMSINDIYTENTYQFVALDIDYMRNEDYGLSDIGEEDDTVEESQNDVNVTIGGLSSPPKIILFHKDHNYYTGITELIILKEDDYDSVVLNGGVLTLYDITCGTQVEYVISPPCGNPRQYQVHLDYNHKYEAKFVEYDTNLESNIDTIIIGAKPCTVSPVVEKVSYVDALDQRLYFRCFGAILYGHDKFAINDSTGRTVYSCDIPDDGMTQISTVVLRDYKFAPETYYTYTYNSKTNDMSSIGRLVFNGYDVRGLYDYIASNLPNGSFSKNKFEEICNTYKIVANELYSTQFLKLKDTLIKDKLLSNYDFYIFMVTICSVESLYINSFNDTSSSRTGPNHTDFYGFYDNDRMEEQYHINAASHNNIGLYTDNNIPYDSILCCYNYNDDNVSECFIVYKPSEDMINTAIDLIGGV